jgi:hypothetical protein
MESLFVSISQIAPQATNRSLRGVCGGCFTRSLVCIRRIRTLSGDASVTYLFATLLQKVCEARVQLTIRILVSKLAISRSPMELDLCLAIFDQDKPWRF